MPFVRAQKDSAHITIHRRKDTAVTAGSTQAGSDDWRPPFTVIELVVAFLAAGCGGSLGGGLRDGGGSECFSTVSCPRRWLCCVDRVFLRLTLSEFVEPHD